MPRSTAPRSFPTASAIVSHTKFIVVDHEIVLLTSANFSYNAENRNIEFGLLIRDNGLGGVDRDRPWRASTDRCTSLCEPPQACPEQAQSRRGKASAALLARTPITIRPAAVDESIASVVDSG